MGKYLSIWEIDQTKIPVDPKERGTGWSFLMALIRQDFEKGITKDWGSFIGGNDGYVVMEGTELEVMKALQQYVPFCVFKLHPIATENHVNQMIKGMIG
jgi:hypothetical protein